MCLITALLLLNLSCASAMWSHPEPEPEYRTRGSGYTRIPVTIEATTWTPQPITRTKSPITTTTTTPGKPIITTTTTTKIRPIIPMNPRPRPNPESEANSYYEPYIEEQHIRNITKKCEMVCHSIGLPSRRGHWKTDTFWSVISGRYNCEMQVLAQKILDNTMFCDFTIRSFDLDTNSSVDYCTHSAILSLASNKLKTQVFNAIEIHVKDMSRDRKRLPILEWPPLSPHVIRGLIKYIYTLRINDFNEHGHIIGLYVGAFFGQLTELMDMIENYLYQSYDSVDLLKQFVTYFRWAHNTNNKPLKANLKRMGAIILKMDQDQYEKFIKDICESFDYKMN